jgi:hypothetical protein
VVGGISVDVEVETAGVGLVAEPPDTMAGVLVDPGLRYLLSVGERHEDGQKRGS